MKFTRCFVAASLAMAVMGLLAGCADKPPPTGQALLADVAKNANDNDTRLAAAKELDAQHQAEAQAAFACVAKTDNNSQVCQAAINHLIDQTLLADVAKNAASCHARFAAAKNLDKQHSIEAQAAFAEFALHTHLYGGCSSYEDVKIAAVEKLTDRKLLAKVAKRANTPKVRQAAVERLAKAVADQAEMAAEK